jgi:hypothetical protein
MQHSLSVPPLFCRLANSGLIWFPNPGVGYFNITDPAPYDSAYFERYRTQANTDIGRALMRIRVEQVRRVMRHGTVCDIGIGSGAFIEAMAQGEGPHAYGDDVNPAAVKWLKDRGLHLYEPLQADGICLWDVLEHIPDFAPVLNRARRFVFLSLPICRDEFHARTFKHFRPREHCWYFTDTGIVAAMAYNGFKLIERHDFEVEAGREDVRSFTFMRG